MSESHAGCPDQALVEALARGEEMPSDVVRHVQSCQRCQSRFRAAQDDAAFVGRAKALVKEELGPIGAPRIPGYRTLSVLKSGAQGVVYKAVQESTSRVVAIKVLGEASADPIKLEDGSTRRRDRAEREVEIVARLRHPNIVTIHESKTLWDGRLALVMEFIDGVSLDTWTPTPAGATAAERRRKLARVMVDVAGAVHHAHLNGVIHRDLKPDNILVTAEGRPVVLDFGVAKLAGPGATLTGEFAGTPAYASPEQVAGKAEDVDALTDVYSLGVILYKLMCGRMPYDVSGSIFEMARTVSEQEPRPARDVNGEIGSDMSAVIMAALRKEKRRRYQSAAALGRDIERCLAGQPVEARSESGWYVLRKAVGMNRRRLGAAVVVGALLAGAGAAVAISVARASASARLATERQEQARAEYVRGKALSEFLREAFPSVDGKNAELNGLIGQGLNRLFYKIETGVYSDDPDVDQEIRRLWGNVYTGFGGRAASFIEYAEISLRHGLVRLRQKYPVPRDHEEVAATMHQLAGVLLMRKRFEESERIARDALGMRERLFGESGALVGESRALLARVLLASGPMRSAEAEREADAALAVLRAQGEVEAPSESGSGRKREDVSIAAMFALKAKLRLQERRLGEAEELVREALKLRLGTLATDDGEFLSSLEDAAAIVDAAPESALAKTLGRAYPVTAFAQAGMGGRLGDRIRSDVELLKAPPRGLFKSGTNEGRTIEFSHRTDAVGRLISTYEVLLPGNDSALLELLLDQVRSAEVENRPVERAASVLRAAEILSRRHEARGISPDFAVLMCVQEAALAQCVAGEYDRAVGLSRRAVEIWESVEGSARDPLLVANAHRYVAWFLILAGRDREGWGEAAAEAALAGDMMERVMGPRHYLAASCRMYEAYAMMKLGELDRADELSRAALKTGLESAATPLDQLAGMRFVRGRVLTARARGMQGIEARATRSEALSLLTQSWEVYLRQVHPQRWFTWTKEAVEDAEELCRGLGDTEGLERWRREGGEAAGGRGRK